ncbi:MAG: FAD-dependent monooxygenase, partial [Bacteroidia bacterium]|nr:FAD-dependent monooxygenase [Bacteroidia bacterium]
MKKELNIAVSPAQAHDLSILKTIVSENLKIESIRIHSLVVRRRSIDARNSNIRINLGLDVFIDEDMPFSEKPTFSYPDVSKKSPVVIVGSGPAGLFAALHLIELGFKPVIFERGKTVSERKRDIAAIHGEHIVDPDSNYGFGEGGAGTFSDGKLYTRSKKKGDVRKILEVLNFHGAQDEILIDAHPHIGTNVLPRIIVAIRNSILNAGGE